MEYEFLRSEMLLGGAAMQKLSSSKVIIFGVGGVGSYVAEALARCAVSQIALLDNDTVNITNINRQLIALHSTIGMAKTTVMKNRIMDINPLCKVSTFNVFYNEDTKNQVNLKDFDYIVDAIDTVSSKLMLIQEAKRLGVPIISSMGTGNKLNPREFEIDDIYNTSVCPLARIMRKELRSRGVNSLKVLYSKEEVLTPDSSLIAQSPHQNSGVRKKATPGSVSFVPSVAGLMIASEVIKDLIAL